MGIFSSKKKNEIENVFEKFSSPDSFKNILNDSKEHSPEQKKISFLFVLIHSNGNLETSRENIERAVSTIKSAGALIDSISSELIFSMFGYPNETSNSRENCEKLSKQLNEQLGKNISLVYGERMSIIGNVGTKEQMSFTFLIPDFVTCLKHLTELKPGEAKHL